MRSDRFALIGLAGLAAVLAVAGLAVVGGPEGARAQRRDEALLRSLAQAVSCVERLERAAYDALPAELGPDADCRPGADAGPAPLRFRREEGNGFALCATFERPEGLPSLRYGLDLDPATGCARGRWDGPAAPQPMDQFELVPFD